MVDVFAYVVIFGTYFGAYSSPKSFLAKHKSELYSVSYLYGRGNALGRFTPVIMDRQVIQKFQQTIWDYYHQHGRGMPWRQPETNGTFDPYKILVSEIMLQQTQVNRVIPKYQDFLRQFPNIQVLAAAPLSEVLITWSGLGYNRRAKYLHEAAKQLASQKRAWKIDELINCKGIGHNTAAAIMAYAYNQPVIFIETNIRSVYIHHFFAEQKEINDKEILSLLEQTLVRTSTRKFYWALMDYGSHLKASTGNMARQSRHYIKQTPFTGSRRQIRGQVLKLLINKPLSIVAVEQNISDDRLSEVLAELENEKLITKQKQMYMLAS